MDILQNMLIEWHTDKEELVHVERILYIAPNRDFIQTIVLFERKFEIIIRKMEKVVADLNENRAKILGQDPFTNDQLEIEGIQIRLEELDRKNNRTKEISKKRQHQWDKRLKAVMAAIVYPDFLDPHKRGQLITAAGESCGFKKMTMYKIVRLYLQGGMTRYAVYPGTFRAGWRKRYVHDANGKLVRRIPKKKTADNTDEQHQAPNVENVTSNDAKTQKENLQITQRDAERHRTKLGRPNILEKSTGIEKGSNVTPEMLALMERGWNMFYLTKKRWSVEEAYQRTLEKFFNDGYKYEKGIRVAILKPPEQRPTINQFRYYLNKIVPPEKKIRRRKGDITFETTHRAHTGNAIDLSFGPDSLHAVDWTNAGISLVHPLDRNKVMDPPTLYFSLDYFSGMFTGIHGTNENASWLTLMLLAENSFTDKVKFCARFGITIDPSEWPCASLPSAMIFDRGEGEGPQATKLAKNLDVDVHNTPPYRADLKGIVESAFAAFKQKLLADLPGIIRKLYPGEKDPRLKAILTLREFIQIVIYYVLDHNANYRMENYPLDQDMIEDRIQPIPIELWNWGIENRTGLSRWEDADMIRFNLLPEGEATVTQDGIKFQGAFFTCRRAEVEGWLSIAAIKGPWKISVAWDPRSAKQIYPRLPYSKKEKDLGADQTVREDLICTLLKRSRIFEDCTWDEVRAILEQKKLDKHIHTINKRQSTAHLNAAVSQIAQSAKEKTELATEGKSARSRIKNRRQTKKEQRDIERKEGAWVFGTESSPDSNQKELVNLSEQQQPVDGSKPVETSKEIAELDRLRKEMWHNEPSTSTRS